MDLEENIRIAAEVYFHNNIEESTLPDTDHFIEMFIAGAKSQAAKDYWYNEFKREQIIEREKINNILRDLRNQPMKPHEGFSGKSEHQMIYYGTSGNGPTDEENELWQKQVVESTYRYDEFVQYRKDNPEEEICYKEWSDMMDNYNKITKEVLDEAVKPFKWINKDEWNALHNPIEAYDKPQIDNGKRPIGIIGHDKMSLAHEIANRISNKKHIIIGVGPGEHCRQESSVIESIVPVIDVLPEQMTNMMEGYDKPWNTKKENETNKKIE